MYFRTFSDIFSTINVKYFETAPSVTVIQKYSGLYRFLYSPPQADIYPSYVSILLPDARMYLS